MIKKIAFASLGLALLAAPLISSADVLSDLQAQVQALMAQLQTLKAQQSAPTTPPQTGQSDDYGTGPTISGVYCPKLSITMQKGSRDATTGNQVSELQTFLTDYYNLDENIVVGGYFGNLTAQYLVKFQLSQGLPAFGIAGSLTRAAIANRCGGGTPTPPISCPQYQMPICPVGQHAEKGVTGTDGCYSAPTCVNDETGFPGLTLQVTPQSSDTFVATVNVGQWTMYSYELDWGEGDSSQQTSRSRVVVVCNSSWTCAAPAGVTHTYATPGLYNIRLYAIKVTDSGERIKTLAATASARVSEVGQNSITVTAPNGGEQWEIGQLNTITWRPYGYNPDVNPANQVSVYLERDLSSVDGGFRTIGKVMDTGKASLHTYFNLNDYQTWAEAGQYYVRAVNNVTGASDRSDAPFTLLPRGVDLKVNGSDGPLTLSDNQPVAITMYIGSPAITSCMLSGVREQVNGGNGVAFGDKYTLNSTTNFSGYAYIPFTPGASTAIYVECTKSDGTKRGDSVQVNVAGTAASLQVISPNGGEQLKPDSLQYIKWSETGLGTVDIALYKNDQWLGWINNSVTPDGQVSWTPSMYRMVTDNVNAGNVFKIYITGQKADGTGYVDDKSDAPFGFTGNTTACTAPHITQPTVGYSLGISPGQNGVAQTILADQPATLSLVNSPTWATISGNTLVFNTVPSTVGTYNFTVVATNVCGLTASITIPIIVSNGTAAIDQSSLTSQSSTPTITGTATDVGAIGISVSNSGGKVYGSGLVGNNGGKWSVTVSQTLSAGTYTVDVYNIFSNVKLTSGTLTITSPTPTYTVAPTTPTNLRGACIGNGQMRLDWDASVGATTYLVRVNDPSNDSPMCQDGWYCAGTSDARIEGTTALSYTGPAVPGKTYSWWLLAGNSAGFSSTVAGPAVSCPSSNGTPGMTSSADPNANLASALTALESALQALLAALGR